MIRGVYSLPNFARELLCLLCCRCSRSHPLQFTLLKGTQLNIWIFFRLVSSNRLLFHWRQTVLVYWNSVGNLTLYVRIFLIYRDSTTTVFLGSDAPSTPYRQAHTIVVLFTLPHWTSFVICFQSSYSLTFLCLPLTHKNQYRFMK